MTDDLRIEDPIAEAWDDEAEADHLAEQHDEAREAAFEEYQAAQEEHDCDGMSKREFEKREAEREGW